MGETRTFKQSDAEAPEQDTTPAEDPTRWSDFSAAGLERRFGQLEGRLEEAYEAIGEIAIARVAEEALKDRELERHAALLEALAKAQGEFEKYGKDADNKHLRSRYATLGSAIRATRPALAANGLSVRQPMTNAGPNLITITTILAHSGGAEVSETLTVPFREQKGINELQAMGLSAKYARRNAYCAMLGIDSEDDDDDGHGAMPAGSGQQKNEADQKKLGDIAEQILKADEEKLVAIVKAVNELPRGDVRRKGWEYFEARCKELTLDPRTIAEQGGAG